jgi:hypothetical protein
MSAVEVGAGAAVGIGVALGGIGLFTLLRSGERAEVKRANRFAREHDLWLPPDFARTVGARLRRREGIGQLMSAVVGAPALGWYFTGMLDHVAASVSSDQIRFFPGPMLFAVLVLPLGLVTVAVHVWDAAHAGRQAVTPTVAPVPVRLERVVPGWLTWTSRLLAVLPPVVAAAVCALNGRTEQALLFAALVIGAGLAAWGIERAQLRLMNPRLVPSGGPELAFDEAFRVSTLLSTVMTAPLLIALAGAWCCVRLTGAGLWAVLLFNGWTGLAVVAAFVVNAVVSAPGVRRYYRRNPSLS